MHVLICPCFGFGGYQTIIKAKSLTSEVPGTLQMARTASVCGAHHTSTQMKSGGSLYFSQNPRGTSMQWAPDTSSTEIHTKCFLCRNSHWSHIQESFICYSLHPEDEIQSPVHPHRVQTYIFYTHRKCPEVLNVTHTSRLKHWCASKSWTSRLKVPQGDVHTTDFTLVGSPGKKCTSIMKDQCAWLTFPKGLWVSRMWIWKQTIKHLCALRSLEEDDKQNILHVFRTTEQ